MDCFHHSSEGTSKLPTLKRSRSVMQRGYSHDHHFQPHLYNPAGSSPNLPHRHISPPQQRRFAGDGFDMRRPVMSTDNYMPPQPPPLLSSQNFVDLTGPEDDEEYYNNSRPIPDSRSALPNPTSRPRRSQRDHQASRLPRFPNAIFGTPEIIDLEEEEEEEVAHVRNRSNGTTQTQHPPTSPEIQVLYERPRLSRPLPPPLPLPRPREPPVVIPDADPGIGIGQGMHPYLRAALNRHVHHHESQQQQPTPPLPRGVGFARHFQVFDRIRRNINYNTVGFNLAQVEPTPEPLPPPPPTLDPLPPVRDGFTRSPTEDDMLVCPSCGDELSVGDTDVKRQVWVVRACGHVYCGECAKKDKRPSTRSKAGKSPPKSNTRTFTKCVVEGCGKSVTAPKSMIQIFL